MVRSLAGVYTAIRASRSLVTEKKTAVGGRMPDMRPQRLMVPVDFTERSLHAARLGANLAARFGASMTLLHASELARFAGLVGEAASAGASLNELQRSYPLWAAEELNALAAELARDGLRIDARVEAGRAGSVILETMAEIEADFVVIGSHGHGSGTHLLGSTTVQIVRSANCPVLVARASDGDVGDDSGRFRRAVVGVDTASDAEATAHRLVTTAAELLVREPASELRAVHVLPDLGADPVLVRRTGEGKSPVKLLERHVHTVAHERVCSIVEQCGLEDLATQGEVEIGRVADVLLERAEIYGADLIAVGAHPPQGVGERIRGTLADAIVRHSTIAVLTVPAGA